MLGAGIRSTGLAGITGMNLKAGPFELAWMFRGGDRSE
jgi:hypothetical protein